MTLNYSDALFTSYSSTQTFDGLPVLNRRWNDLGDTATIYSWEFDLFKKATNIDHIPDANGDEKQLTTVPDIVKKAIEQSTLTDYVPHHAPPVVLKLGADGTFDGPVVADADLEGSLRTDAMLVITFYAEAYRSGNGVSLILHPQDFAVIGQTMNRVRKNVPVTPRTARIRRFAAPKIPMPMFTSVSRLSHLRVKIWRSNAGSSSSNVEDWEEVLQPTGSPGDEVPSPGVDDQTDVTLSSSTESLSRAPKRARVTRSMVQGA